ncbi:MAG: bifunctional diaminohydroxyphosphoribosylaminopyrimidine deaminase/5-amino-6-(5-phosphoribosylamino)uracil reductase RibD [Pseudomonadota bacterium]
MADAERHMRRALKLAERGAGFVSPNPLVGCVIVRDGAVVGEGWHHAAGEPHAEVEALKAAGENARGATLYVTLEPCNHHGRTPPCTDAILAAGVTEVVYAAADPNPKAAGGAARLAEAGVRVRGGVCENDAHAQNRVFFASLLSNRPYVFAKFAASLDGKIATRTGDSQWITGREARARGHDLRQMADAILVGADTVIADDPSLTARPEGRTPAHPLRVILDSRGRTPIEARVFDPELPGRTLIAGVDTPSPLRAAALAARNVEVLTVAPDDKGRVDIAALLIALKARGVQSVMVEGGGAALGSVFDAGLVDEVWAFLAPVIIGGESPSPVGGLGVASLAEAFRLNACEVEQAGTDILLRGLVQRQRTEAACLRAS